MNPLRFLIFLLAFACPTLRAEPDPSPTPPPPFLEIFEARIKGDKMTEMGFDSKHPLLQISVVRALHLARDNKGVLLVLMDDDAKKFASITREFDGRPLMFKAGDTIRPVTINGAVEDGKIGFKYPEASAMAEQLRRIFHVGEFENP